MGQAEAAAQGVPSPPREPVDSNLRVGHPNPLSWCHILYVWVSMLGSGTPLAVPTPWTPTGGTGCKRKPKRTPLG